MTHDFLFSCTYFFDLIFKTNKQDFAYHMVATPVVDIPSFILWHFLDIKHCEHGVFLLDAWKRFSMPLTHEVIFNFDHPDDQNLFSHFHFLGSKLRILQSKSMFGRWKIKLFDPKTRIPWDWDVPNIFSKDNVDKIFDSSIATTTNSNFQVRLCIIFSTTLLS